MCGDLELTSCSECHTTAASFFDVDHAKMTIVATWYSLTPSRQ